MKNFYQVLKLFVTNACSVGLVINGDKIYRYIFLNHLKFGSVSV